MASSPACGASRSYSQAGSGTPTAVATWAQKAIGCIQIHDRGGGANQREAIWRARSMSPRCAKPSAAAGAAKWAMDGWSGRARRAAS